MQSAFYFTFYFIFLFFFNFNNATYLKPAKNEMA